MANTEKEPPRDQKKFFRDLLEVIAVDQSAGLKLAITKFGEPYVLSLKDRNRKNVLVICVEANARKCVSLILGTREAKRLCADTDSHGRTALHVAYECDAKAKSGGHAFDARIVPMVEAYSEADVGRRHSIYREITADTLKKHKKDSTAFRWFKSPTNNTTKPPTELPEESATSPRHHRAHSPARHHHHHHATSPVNGNHAATEEVFPELAPHDDPPSSWWASFIKCNCAHTAGDGDDNPPRPPQPYSRVAAAAGTRQTPGSV